MSFSIHRYSIRVHQYSITSMMSKEGLGDEWETPSHEHPGPLTLLFTSHPPCAHTSLLSHFKYLN